MVRLRGQPDFVVFMEVVRDYERNLVERAVGAIDTPLIYRAQGGIAAFRGLLESVDLAPELIRKMAGK